MTLRPHLQTLFLVLAVCLAQGHDLQSHYQCIDNLNDFESQNWDASSSFGYAQSGKDLPLTLRDKLEGHGIFYFVGGQEVNQALIQWSMEFSQSQPAFLYIKYYGHFSTIKDNGGSSSGGHAQGMYVIPATSRPFKGDEAHLRNLRSTTDFVWHEEILQLNVQELHRAGLEVGTFNLNPGDYFLVEKLILVQGVNIQSVDQIKKFCSPSSWPSTVTPSNDPTDFVCPREGYFPEPKDCVQFHLCQLDKDGRLWDSAFTCPAGSVWCQENLRCQNPEFCSTHH